MIDVATLLARSKVSHALIVDDAYDEVPLALDLAGDAEEWTHFFEDVNDGDRSVLRELYTEYDDMRGDELQANDRFVAALWRGKGRLRPELINPLFLRYSAAIATDLVRLEELKSNLEAFGLTCRIAGRDFGAPSADADLIVIDLFLGSGQRPDEMEIAIEGLAKVIKSRSAQPPIVVLMSRSSRLEEKREDFRNRCGLFASAFRISSKDDLSDHGKLSRLLARLATHFEDSLKLANFVDAWRRGLDGARDRTSELIRKLELSDHAQIRQLLLSTEGEPTGSYLVDVFDAVLRHEIEREPAIIDGAAALNTLTSDVYPPPYLAGSRDLQDLVYRSLFQNRERLRLQGVEGSPVAFGDLLMRKAAPAAFSSPAPVSEPAPSGGATEGATAYVPPDQPPALHGIEFEQVLLTVTPACELQRKGEGAKNVMFLVGRLRPLRPADWQYKDDPVRTPVIELSDGSRSWIRWDLKHVVTLSPAEISALFDDPAGFAPIARLRESHALELQQKLLSSLGRVGQTAPMPATFLMRVEVLLPNADRKLISVPVSALAEDGVCFVGRPGDKDMRLVLTEDQCEGISEAIAGYAIEQVHPSAHTAFTYLRDSSDLLVALERGITLPSLQNTYFRDIPSPTGAKIGGNIRTIGLIVRNRPMDDVLLPASEVPKAGIVLATWDRLEKP
jgi:hypothetical protein